MLHKLILVLLLAAAAATANCQAPSSGTASAPAAGSRFPTGTAPGSVEIADFNGDGKFDCVVANEQSNNVTVLLGDRKGGFKQAKGSPFPAGHAPNDIAVGDFNRDGKLDLAFANHEEKHLTVLLGDGQGGFTPGPNSPLALEVKPHVHGVATGDFDGDGNLDLVTDSWADDQVLVVFGDGKGGFKTPGTFLTVGKRPYQRVRAADVNGDGKADVITTNSEGNNVSVLLSDGKGGFKQSAGSPFACGDAPFNFAIGDVNNDGKPDLAVVNSPSSMAEGHGKDGLTVMLGDGQGAFTMLAGSSFATGKIPNRVAMGDVNGDGVNDIAVSSPDDNNIQMFLMSGRGAVASSYRIAVAGKPKGLAIRDLNGDGKADIVVTNNGDNFVTIILSK
ncbi:MAG TPA: VCBS repeat-containing protein [Pyrinomonadaceae bacterium]|nr:VCBS repeat-containing protein [Pyrinomonadaceae bacterium]